MPTKVHRQKFAGPSRDSHRLIRASMVESASAPSESGQPVRSVVRCWGAIERLGAALDDEEGGQRGREVVDTTDTEERHVDFVEALRGSVNEAYAHPGCFANAACKAIAKQNAADFLYPSVFRACAECSAGKPAVSI